MKNKIPKWWYVGFEKGFVYGCMVFIKSWFNSYSNPLWAIQDKLQKKGMIDNELKPCKYCGGKPQLIPVGDFREYYAYRCSNCGEYHAQFGEARCTIRGAKKVWNRRATDDK